VLVDSHNASTIIPHMDLARGRELLSSGLIVGGMAPKVQNCLQAVERGVGKVVILNGRIEHALLLEATSQKSLGTTITKDGTK
jgi:acetylglutamate kinase